MWEFSDKWSNRHDICMKCGMMPTECICDYSIDLSPSVEIWLLVGERELKRSSNTGRLIAKAIKTTKVYQWMRSEPPKALVDAINSNEFDIYLVMSADREEEKVRVREYVPSDKKTVFLLLDGTWKEVRKMVRKSDYLSKLPILSFNPKEKSSYFLRRNKDDHHLCTVEAGIQLLSLSDNLEEAEALNAYYEVFLASFNRSLRESTRQ